MAHALDVTRYILDRRAVQGHETTTFALQKLLYYAQSWMLVARNQALFPESIEAWKHGAVVPSVYRKYCAKRRHIQASDVREDSVRNLTVDEQAVVDSVLALYEHDDDETLGDALEQMNHAEQPWQNAYQPKANNIISQESMLEYYSKVQADPEAYKVSRVPKFSDAATRTFVDDEDWNMLQSILAK